MYIESKYKKAGVLFLIQLVTLIAAYVYMNAALGTRFDAFDNAKKAMVIGNGIALLIISVSMMFKFHWGVLGGTAVLTVTHIMLLTKVIDIVTSPYMSWLPTDSKLMVYFTMAYLILVPLAYIIMSIALFANTAAQRMKGFASLAGLFVALGSLPYTVYFTKAAVKQKIDYGKYLPELTTKELIVAIILIVGTLCLIAGIATAAGAYIVKAKAYKRMDNQEQMYSQNAYGQSSTNSPYGGSYYDPRSAHPQSDTTTQSGPKFYSPFGKDTATTEETSEQSSYSPYYSPYASTNETPVDPYAPIDKE